MKQHFVVWQGEFYNYSGCGNTFNCNHPTVRRFIIDCLRYMHLAWHPQGTVLALFEAVELRTTLSN